MAKKKPKYKRSKPQQGYVEGIKLLRSRHGFGKKQDCAIKVRHGPMEEVALGDGGHMPSQLNMGQFLSQLEYESDSECDSDTIVMDREQVHRLYAEFDGKADIDLICDVLGLYELDEEASREALRSMVASSDDAPSHPNEAFANVVQPSLPFLAHQPQPPAQRHPEPTEEEFVMRMVEMFDNLPVPTVKSICRQYSNDPDAVTQALLQIPAPSPSDSESFNPRPAYDYHNNGSSPHSLRGSVSPPISIGSQNDAFSNKYSSGFPQPLSSPFMQNSLPHPRQPLQASEVYSALFESPPEPTVEEITQSKVDRLRKEFLEMPIFGSRVPGWDTLPEADRRLWQLWDDLRRDLRVHGLRQQCVRCRDIGTRSPLSAVVDTLPQDCWIVTPCGHLLCQSCCSLCTTRGSCPFCHDEYSTIVPLNVNQ